MSVEVKYVLGKHNDKGVILIQFPYNKDLIERVKKLPDAKWSNSKRSWYVPDSADNRTRFDLPPKENDAPALLSKEAIEKTEKFVQWLRSKRYSENTIKTYREALLMFLRFYHQK